MTTVDGLTHDRFVTAFDVRSEPRDADGNASSMVVDREGGE